MEPRASDEGPDTSEYPPPLIVEPTDEHKETWIILHGRGDRATSFARGYMGFLNMIFPDGRTIQQHLPNVRFVFPTASPRRARVFNRAMMTQWFDIYSWNSTEKTDWQIRGLQETTAWISELVRRESEVIGSQNIVVGGLSQGCASVLVWNLVRNQEKIKCVFGMSGWLPFRHLLEVYLPNEDVSEQTVDGDVFETTERDADPCTSAVKALQDELDIRAADVSLGRGTPILIAHGAKDDKVDVEHGILAVKCLSRLGCKVQYKEYSTLKHWFHGPELLDVVNFVQQSREPDQVGIVT